MYQPTIDSHLPTRQLHVQVSRSGWAPNASLDSLAALGAHVLAARTRPSLFGRFLAAINRRSSGAQSTRPTRVAAR